MSDDFIAPYLCVLDPRCIHGEHSTNCMDLNQKRGIRLRERERQQRLRIVMGDIDGTGDDRRCPSTLMLAIGGRREAVRCSADAGHDPAKHIANIEWEDPR